MTKKQRIAKTIRQRLTKPLVAMALRKMDGNISRAAAACGTVRSTIHHWIQRHPELKEIVNDARLALYDDAVTSIGAMVRNPNHPHHHVACIFTLKCHGKDDGWVERSAQEISGPDGGPMQVSTIVRLPVKAEAGEWDKLPK